MKKLYEIGNQFKIKEVLQICDVNVGDSLVNKECDDHQVSVASHLKVRKTQERGFELCFFKKKSFISYKNQSIRKIK